MCMHRGNGTVGGLYILVFALESSGLLVEGVDHMNATPEQVKVADILRQCICINVSYKTAKDEQDAVFKVMKAKRDVEKFCAPMNILEVQHALQRNVATAYLD